MPNDTPQREFRGGADLGSRRPRLTQEERRTQNLQHLQQFGSLVVVPRSGEARIMVRMMYPLNRALSKLRRLVGMPLSIEHVRSAIQPITEWTQAAEQWLRKSGGDFIFASEILRNSAQERVMLAQERDAHVIVPSTDEARVAIETLIRMDHILSMLRMVSLDSLQNDGRLDGAHSLIQTLNAAVGHVCESAQIEYRQPRGIASAQQEKDGVSDVPRGGELPQKGPRIGKRVA